MGLNDELEKIRQAAEWLRTEPSDTEKYRAAMGHLIYVAANNDNLTLRSSAQRVLDSYPVEF